VKPFGHRRAGHRPVDAAGTRLVDEAEAYLSGTYEENLRYHRDSVPGWVRLNVLAHGDLERLHQVRRSSTNGDLVGSFRPTEGGWEQAQRILAAELLDAVGADSMVLSRVQLGVLVPLELRLMRFAGELRAYELVQITRAALRLTIA